MSELVPRQVEELARGTRCVGFSPDLSSGIPVRNRTKPLSPPTAIFTVERAADRPASALENTFRRRCHNHDPPARFYPTTSPSSMKAICWHGKSDPRLDNVPDPTLQELTDVIIQVGEEK